MTGKHSADLSWPLEDAVDRSSPVQQILKLLRTIIGDTPVPESPTREAYFAAPILATHILHLLEGAGHLNAMGCHSVAVSLFRPLEDALDCLAAVGLVPEAAERWLKDELKLCKQQ